MECLQKDFRRGLCRLFRSWKTQTARPLSLTLEKNTARPERWSKKVLPNGRKVPVPNAPLPILTEALSRGDNGASPKGPKDHTTEVISKENRDESQGRPKGTESGQFL